MIEYIFYYIFGGIISLSLCCFLLYLGDGKYYGSSKEFFKNLSKLKAIFFILFWPVLLFAVVVNSLSKLIILSFQNFYLFVDKVIKNWLTKNGRR